MITMMIVSYILNWVFIIYSLATAKTDIELWGEETE
jgi:hypothetical protein